VEVWPSADLEILQTIQRRDPPRSACLHALSSRKEAPVDTHTIPHISNRMETARIASKWVEPMAWMLPFCRHIWRHSNGAAMLLPQRQGWCLPESLNLVDSCETSFFRRRSICILSAERPSSAESSWPHRRASRKAGKYSLGEENSEAEQDLFLAASKTDRLKLKGQSDKRWSLSCLVDRP
jgi:hypothetical protein